MGRKFDDNKVFYVSMSPSIFLRSAHFSRFSIVSSCSYSWAIFLLWLQVVVFYLHFKYNHYFLHWLCFLFFVVTTLARGQKKMTHHLSHEQEQWGRRWEKCTWETFLWTASIVGYKNRGKWRKQEHREQCSCDDDDALQFTSCFQRETPLRRVTSRVSSVSLLLPVSSSLRFHIRISW